MKRKVKILFSIVILASLVFVCDRYYLKQIRLEREDAILDKCFCEKTKQGFPVVLKIISPNIEKLENNSFVAISQMHSCNIKFFKAYIKYEREDMWYCIDTLRSCDNYTVIETGKTKSVFFKIEGYDGSNKFIISDSVNYQLKESSKSEYIINKVTDIASFNPRDGAGCVEFNNKLFLIGGWNEDVNYTYINNEVWTSANAKNWTLLGKVPFDGRHCFGMVKFKNAIWVVGGDCNSGNCQRDIWKSIDGITWLKVADSLKFLDRANYSVIVFKNKLWLFGGQKMPKFVPNHEDDEGFNDAWSSEDGINWKNESIQLNWQGRAVFNSVVVFNNCLYLFGGDIYQTKSHNDVWKSEDGINWIKVSSHSPWKQAQFKDVVIFDQKIWIIGGSYDMKNINEIWYSNDGICWRQLRNQLFPSRHASSVVVFKSRLNIIAGNSRNDIWQISKKNGY